EAPDDPVARVGHAEGHHVKENWCQTPFFRRSKQLHHAAWAGKMVSDTNFFPGEAAAAASPGRALLRRALRAPALGVVLAGLARVRRRRYPHADLRLLVPLRRRLAGRRGLAPDERQDVADLHVVGDDAERQHAALVERVAV